MCKKVRNCCKQARKSLRGLSRRLLIEYADTLNPLEGGEGYPAVVVADLDVGVAGSVGL